MLFIVVGARIISRSFSVNEVVNTETIVQTNVPFYRDFNTERSRCVNNSFSCSAIINVWYLIFFIEWSCLFVFLLFFIFFSYVLMIYIISLPINPVKIFLNYNSSYLDHFFGNRVSNVIIPDKSKICQYFMFTLSQMKSCSSSANL